MDVNLVRGKDVAETQREYYVDLQAFEICIGRIYDPGLIPVAFGQLSNVRQGVWIFISNPDGSTNNTELDDDLLGNRNGNLLSELYT